MIQVMQLLKLPVFKRCFVTNSVTFTKLLYSEPVAGFCQICGSELPVIKKHKPFQSPSTKEMLPESPTGSSVFVLKRRLHILRPDTYSKFHQNFNFSKNYSSVTTATVVTNDSISSSGLFYNDIFPVYGTVKAFEYIHHLTGLPWWATIILTAFILRAVIVVPFSIFSFRNAAKLQHLQPEIKATSERLKKEVAMAMHQFGWDQKRALYEYRKNMQRLLKDFYIRGNCHPMKTVAVYWIQFPVWISVSCAVRNLTAKALNPDIDGHADVKDMSEQGLAWFPDLTTTDSTLLLPLLMGAVTLLNVELNYLNLPEITRYRKWLTYGLRGFSLFFIPVCAVMPSSLVLYWLSSSVFATAQHLLFDYSAFRRLIGLPVSPTESRSPFRALGQKFKSRYWNR